MNRYPTFNTESKKLVPRAIDVETLSEQLIPIRDAFLSIPLTKGQKRAVIRAAEKLGLDAASYARMRILENTPYDPEADEDLSGS